MVPCYAPSHVSYSSERKEKKNFGLFFFLNVAVPALARCRNFRNLAILGNFGQNRDSCDFCDFVQNPKKNLSPEKIHFPRFFFNISFFILNIRLVREKYFF